MINGLRMALDSSLSSSPPPRQPNTWVNRTLRDLSPSRNIQDPPDTGQDGGGDDASSVSSDDMELADFEDVQTWGKMKDKG